MFGLRNLIPSVAAWTVVAVATTSALGATLVQIPTYNGPGYSSGTFAGDTTEGRAVSPDGKYVIGLCVGTNTVAPNPPTASQVGILWDLTNPTKWVIQGGRGSSICTGVTYRTVPAGQQLVVHGLSSGHPIYYFSTDVNAATPFPTSLRDSTLSGEILGTTGTVCGLGLDDVVYGIWHKLSGSTYMLHTEKVNSEPGVYAGRDKKDIPSNIDASIQGVSGVGMSVGRRKFDMGGGTFVFGNYFLQYRGTATLPSLGTQFAGFLPGLDGTNAGEAWAVSQDGTKVFGLSPVTGGRPGSWPYMMTVVPNTDPLTGSIPTQTAIVELPTYPDTAGSVSNGRAYGCSVDGGFAVGMNYRGQERAVLWDLRDPAPANWKVYDLTAYFGALGQLGSFSRLIRAYDVEVDSVNSTVVVTGIGTAAAQTQGFVVTIPLSAFPLPDTGACCIIGSCTSKFQADCPDIPGNQRYTVNTLCINAACPGACCNDNGTCSDFVESAACIPPAGIFRGSSTSCGTTTCEGACCLGFQACEQADYGACAGDFAGIGVSCEAAACPCTTSTHIWADADRDGDLDIDDFAVFQICFTGPGGGVPAGCSCFDRSFSDPSGIDTDDFVAFENCATGSRSTILYDSLNPPPGCVP